MTSDHLIHAKCPSCHARITLRQASLAKKVRCPKCRQLIVISAPAENGAQEAAGKAASTRDERSPPEPTNGVIAGAPPTANAAPPEPVTTSIVSPPPPAAAMNPEEETLLRLMVDAIEREPSQTHFVFVKGMGPLNGVYRIHPGQAHTLARLKALLRRGTRLPHAQLRALNGGPQTVGAEGQARTGHAEIPGQAPRNDFLDTASPPVADAPAE